MVWIEWTIYVFAVILLILANAGCVFLVALQLPGSWVMLLLTGIFAWVYWDGGEGPMGWWSLLAMLALAILGEIIEFAAGAMGAAKAGASRRGTALALVGGVLGAIVGTLSLPIPIVGTLVGAALGAGAGTLAGDLWAGREWEPSLKSTGGAVIGKFAGALGKVIVAALMVVVFLLALAIP